MHHGGDSRFPAFIALPRVSSAEGKCQPGSVRDGLNEMAFTWRGLRNVADFIMAFHATVALTKYLTVTVV